MSRTLGIDPGTAIMGFGVVDAAGNQLRAVQFGVWTTSSTDALPYRLRVLHEHMVELIESTQPSAVAVESLFFNRNVRTALSVGQARGIALLAAAQANLEVHEYTPQQVKDA